MNLQEFDSNFGKLKDKDMININCDFSEHVGDRNRTMARVSARRNILKNNSIEFICKDCSMTHKNPMKNRDAIKRQTDDEIVVICLDDRHRGDKTRKIKMSGYFGSLEQPYAQTCKSCAQLDKVISEEQKKKISKALTGIERSNEFKQKLRNYMKSNLEGIARFTKNLLENRCTTGMLGKHHSEETKKKMSMWHKLKGKKIIQYDSNDNFIKIFLTINDAIKENDISESSIRRCCRNQNKILKGFKWKYEESI
jgi:hypothetical protein